MRFTRKLAVLGVLAAFSLPAFAAPLEEGWRPPQQQQDAGDRNLPVRPVVRTPLGGSLADSDRNGMSDGLEQKLAELAPNQRVKVIVTFSGRGNAAAAQRAVGAFDLRHEFTLISGFAATMTAAQARALATAPGVFRVEEDGTKHASLETARRDFGVEQLKADPLTTDLTGAGIGICVVDTGILASHEQFVDEATGATKVVAFVDYIGDIDNVFHTTPYDDHGHGTHVSGIAAGDGTGSGLGAQLQGVAPGAELYIAKVLDLLGNGDDSAVIQGVEWCGSQPEVDVINLSLAGGGSSDGLDALSLVVDQLANAGKIVIAGAGNSGAAPFTISSPAAAQQAITVGAAAEWSQAANPAWQSAGVYLAPFSSRGPTKDGRIKPDIVAPGVTIGSAFSDYFGIYGCGNGCYDVLSGTSMSTPFVAGTVALMIEAAGQPLSTAETLQILAATAHDRGPVAGKDNEWGFGLLDAYAAVAQARGLVDVVPMSFPSVELGAGSVANNGTTLIPIEVTDGGAPLAVTVTIDGSLGSLGWKPDLEARLLDGNGEPFLEPNPFYPWLSPDPFIPASGTESTCAAGEECGLVGRQETVHLTAPAPGSYFLEIWTFDGFPNNGAGGSFSYEISKAPVVEPPPVPAVMANAGADQTVVDTDRDGSVTVVLDGSGSTGDITSYSWSAAGLVIPDGVTSVVTLPLGSTTITLTVSDVAGATGSDTVVVTVEKIRGKPCNPRKEVCS